MGIAACSPQPVTPGIVTFVPADFKTAYPAFASVPDAVLTGYFGIATLFLNNSCCSIVQDAPTRALLLNLVVAHIAALLAGENGQPGQGVVGRINSASEGSVSVSTEMMAKSESAAYWQQTQYGAMFWQATLVYRTARYVPPVCGPVGFSPWDAWPQ